MRCIERANETSPRLTADAPNEHPAVPVEALPRFIGHSLSVVSLPPAFIGFKGDVVKSQLYTYNSMQYKTNINPFPD